MDTVAFVTANSSLKDDFDMPELLAACRAGGLAAEVCAWDDRSIDWSRYQAVVLRSPWDYSERLAQFLAWGEQVTGVTKLFNPLSAVKWSLDKHYLLDLANFGVPVVPSEFVEPGAPAEPVLRAFLTEHTHVEDFVVKPAIGCYSKGVRRYRRGQAAEAAVYVASLLEDGSSAILQPYLSSIDRNGETNLIYFDGIYSHAIRKGALLTCDGTVHAPTYEFRQAREADDNERAAAESALEAARAHLHLQRPLLYARVDLIRDSCGKPCLLELEIAEPSLSLPLADGGATRFAHALSTVVTASQEG